MNNVQQWDAWQSLESMTELIRCLWVINRTYRRIFGWTLCWPRWKSWAGLRVFETGAFKRWQVLSANVSILKTCLAYLGGLHVIWRSRNKPFLRFNHGSSTRHLAPEPPFPAPKNGCFSNVMQWMKNHFGDKVLTLGIKSSNKIINPQLFWCLEVGETSRCRKQEFRIRWWAKNGFGGGYSPLVHEVLYTQTNFYFHYHCQSQKHIYSI